MASAATANLPPTVLILCFFARFRVSAFQLFIPTRFTVIQRRHGVFGMFR
jgi:hypothetical protein